MVQKFWETEINCQIYFIQHILKLSKMSAGASGDVPVFVQAWLCGRDLPFDQLPTILDVARYMFFLEETKPNAS